MTISRREWRGTFVPSQSSIYTEDHTTFGWKVRQHIMPPGSKLITISSKTIDRANAPNISLTVRGESNIFSDNGTVYPNRTPGVFSPERADIPQGTTTMIALSEFEFWCFNWTANRRSLPDVQPLRLAESEEIVLPQGQRVFICLGELGNYYAGNSFIANGLPLLSHCTTYGFLIGDSNV